MHLTLMQKQKYKVLTKYNVNLKNCFNSFKKKSLFVKY